METKLRQLLPNLGGWNFTELNPNPLADNLGNFKESRRLAVKQREQVFRFQSAVSAAFFQVNLRQLFSVQLFGSALESRFLIL